MWRLINLFVCLFLVEIYSASHIYLEPYYTCILVSLFMPRNSILLNEDSFYCHFWSSFFLLILWAFLHSFPSLDRVRLSSQNPETLSLTAQASSVPAHRTCVPVCDDWVRTFLFHPLSYCSLPSKIVHSLPL